MKTPTMRRSNPTLAEVAMIAERVADALPTLAGPEFGSADYEAAFAAALDAVSVARDEVHGRTFDVLVQTVGVELSAGNYWLDRCRLARLLLEPGHVPVVYGFVERMRDPQHEIRVVRVWLARPQRLRRYYGITTAKAATYLEDDRLAPSTLNNQQHVRRCDVAYIADYVCELGPTGGTWARVTRSACPPKRRRAA